LHPRWRGRSRFLKTDPGLSFEEARELMAKLRDRVAPVYPEVQFAGIQRVD
jgi:hypothetical protein